MDGLRKAERRILNALRVSIGTYQRLSASIISSALIFLLFAFTTDIPWHIQTLESGVQYWDDALYNSVTGILIGGRITFALTVIYSILAGLALTNLAIQIMDRNLSISGLGSILPGFVATGCAGCGVGLIGILGFTGSAAIFPFGGDLFKVAGIILIVYALYRFGDPRICEFSPGS